MGIGRSPASVRPLRIRSVPLCAWKTSIDWFPWLVRCVEVKDETDEDPVNGTTHVGAASPRKTDRLQGETTGGRQPHDMAISTCCSKESLYEQANRSATIGCRPPGHTGQR